MDRFIEREALWLYTGNRVNVRVNENALVSGTLLQDSDSLLFSVGNLFFGTKDVSTVLELDGQIYIHIQEVQ